MYLLSFLRNLAVLGPWGIVPIYVVSITFFVPLAILGLAAGATFGFPTGFLVNLFSSTISAGLVFLAGRYFTRGWVFKKIEANPKIRAVDEAVTNGGWKMVVLVRLAGVFPYSVTNYILGLSKIPFRDYILATWFLMMPTSLLYAYLGSLGGEIIFEGHAPQKTTLEWVFFAISFIATIALGIYATKRVKKILICVDREPSQ